MRIRLLQTLRAHWFLTGILIVIPLGLFVPATGLQIKAWRCDLWVVMTMMFLSGVTLATRDLVKQARNFTAIGFSFCIVYLLAPVLAFLFAHMFFPGDTGMLIGIMVLGAQNSTLVSGFVLTGIAGGNAPLALVITVFNSATSMLMTPLILSISLSLDSSIEFDALEMTLRIATVVLLPFGVGQIVRRIALPWMERIKPIASIVSQLCVLTLMLAGISQGSARLLSAPLMIAKLVFALATLHLLLNLLAFQLGRLARFDTPSRIAAGICSSQKSLPAGFYIANNFFPSVPVAALPIVVYHVCQLIIDSLQASWLVRHASQAADAPESSV
ncbi:bile acid:sodium symporter [Candidatus Sumerlaeota bacterium]|nr:bile acid:sodium symporter [Candidatus Sumerlaeota bacterium]